MRINQKTPARILAARIKRRSRMAALKRHLSTGTSRGAFAGVLFVATAGLAQNSADEDVSPNTSVSDRFARNFGPDGVPAGGFTLFPSATLAAIYDDNIFGVSQAETDDFIADLGGTLRVRSNWSTHGLDLAASVRRLQFSDNSDESTTDYFVGGNLTFDFSERSDVAFRASYREATEPRRFTQTAVGALDPVRFSTSTFGVDFDLRQNRFAQAFGLEYRIDDFDDALAVGGGVIDQDFRDREILSVYGRQFFRVRPAIAFFIGADAEWQEYDAPQLGFGAVQDSDGYGVSGGVAFDINKVARGEIGVGYQKRDYDDPIFPDIDGLNVDASFEYFLSDLTTVTVEADRSIRDTAVPGVAGYYSNAAGLTIEHELLRPVLLVGDVEYRQDDFRGIDREDKLFTASAGVDYAFRREVIVSLRYSYFDFSSSGAAARDPFEESVVRLGLELRL